MGKFVTSLTCTLIMLAAPLVMAQAASLDCGGRTVSTEESRIDLLMKCGEPDSKESHQEVLIDISDNSLTQKTYITVEEWTYNFGPAQFMRIVTLKNGKIADIRTGDYGYSKDAKPEKSEFSDRIVSIGESMGEVIAKWGEPAGKETRQEELKEKLDRGQERKTIVTMEDWTYNFGSNRLMRILTFKNSKLVEIRTSGYGYDKK